MVMWMLGLALAGQGWRNGGSAAHPSADPPITWEVGSATWTVETPAWGNATPVRLGDQICAQSEPTTVFCLDAKTGAERWRATNDWLDTVPADKRGAEATRLANAASLTEQMRAAQRRVSELRRELRRGGDPDALAAASKELDRLKREHDALMPYLTPPVLDVIGYGSASPWSDGRHLYVATGNGVVSSFTASGTRRWSVYVGASPRPMEGYEFGTASSPALVDGVLVVPLSTLHGLDPETGKVLWSESTPWRHYGTPAVASLSGGAVVLTPNGRLVRARDGRQVGDLGIENWYVGPVVDGDVVYWAGGMGNANDPDNAKVRAYTLSGTADAVTATPLWTTTLPNSDRVYVSPLVHDGLVYVLNLSRELMVLDAASGAVVYQRSLRDLLITTPYPNLTLAGGAIFAGDEQGHFVAFSPGRTFTVLGKSVVPGLVRATPVFEGETVYLRGLERMWRLR
jgi:outer membrane protein assembly factor BamB